MPPPACLVRRIRLPRTAHGVPPAAVRQLHLPAAVRQLHLLLLTRGVGTRCRESTEALNATTPSAPLLLLEYKEANLKELGVVREFAQPKRIEPAGAGLASAAARWRVSWTSEPKRSARGGVREGVEGPQRYAASKHSLKTRPTRALCVAGEAYEDLLDEHRRTNVSVTKQREEEDACVEIRCTVLWDPVADIAVNQLRLVRPLPPSLPRFLLGGE